MKLGSAVEPEHERGLTGAEAEYARLVEEVRDGRRSVTSVIRFASGHLAVQTGRAGFRLGRASARFLRRGRHRPVPLIWKVAPVDFEIVAGTGTIIWVEVKSHRAEGPDEDG